MKCEEWNTAAFECAVANDSNIAVKYESKIFLLMECFLLLFCEELITTLREFIFFSTYCLMEHL